MHIYSSSNVYVKHSDGSDSDSSSRDDFLAVHRDHLHVYPDVISPDTEVSLCIQLSDRLATLKNCFSPAKKYKNSQYRSLHESVLH